MFTDLETTAKVYELINNLRVSSSTVMRGFGRSWERLTTWSNSSVWCDTSMTACSLKYWTVEILLTHPYGIKHGCILGPTLFSMIFPAMQSDAFCSNDETRIKIRFRFSDRLFKLQCLQAKIKVKDAAEQFWLHNDFSESRGHVPICPAEPVCELSKGKSWRLFIRSCMHRYISTGILIHFVCN